MCRTRRISRTGCGAIYRKRSPPPATTSSAR